MKHWVIIGAEAVLKREVEIVKGIMTVYSYNLRNKNIKFILKNDSYITDAEREELLSYMDIQKQEIVEEAKIKNFLNRDNLLKVNNIEVRQFEGYDNYEATGAYDVIDVVKNGKYINADLLTECKSYKTALRRFFKGLKDIKEFNGWKECLKESCECGYLEQISRYPDKSLHYRYEVEQQDETLWYVMLIIEIIPQI